MAEFEFDLFVIGGGSGGVRASRVAASLGAKVAVAEERYFGGTCVNVGCVPKKLFSYAAHYRDDIEDSRGFGWEIDNARFNWSTLKSNKDKEINRLESIYRSILENNKVTIFEGRARLAGPNLIEINGKQVSARHVLIAVGGWPQRPRIEGNELMMTSNELFSLEKLPNSMLIVGGGYIAVEFASIFTRMGVDTTLVYRGDKLLRGFDTDVRDFITTEIKHSLNLVLNSSPSKIIHNNNMLEVIMQGGSGYSAEAILAATGRAPLTGDLGLDTVKVNLDAKGAIQVDENFETSEPGIYAVGDVIDRVALTPVALAEGQIVSRRLFGNSDAGMEYRNIPSAVFCQPNIGTVGLTEDQARELGSPIDIYTATVKQLKHTLSGRNEMSFLKLVVNAKDDKVIGVHMVGPDAGELIQGFAVALNSGATKSDFDRTIGIHPTLAEEFVTMRTKRKSHLA